MEPNQINQNPTPAPMPPVEPPRHWRPRSIVGPVILILLGLAFLSNNLHIFQFNVWEMMWRLWPVWLIAAGLDMALGRRTSWGSWIVLGLVIAVVGFAVWASNLGFAWGNGSYTTAERVQITSEMKEATRANVEIKSGLGKLQLDGRAGNNLVEGVVGRLNGERLSQDYNNNNGQLNFTLKSEGVNVVPGIHIGNQDGLWDLHLNKNIPMDLNLGTGIGQASIDLTGLQLNSLDVNTGIGECSVTLPATGKFYANVKSGIGQTTVYIPRGMAARINVNNGIGAVNIHGVFSQSGRTYVTQGFDSAANRVELNVNGGIGEVAVFVN